MDYRMKKKTELLVVLSTLLLTACGSGENTLDSDKTVASWLEQVRLVCCEKLFVFSAHISFQYVGQSHNRTIENAR